LSRQLLDLYRPTSLLVDEAAGIALVLLAAASPGAPVWDRLFVLS
jgi:hypothetical protein